ncbi:MAG: GrpB family protein [Patescibacteria group bacterium]
MVKTDRKRIGELVKEKIEIVPYNPEWPKMFEGEESFLRSKIPTKLIGRIEHFGSTAIPNLSAKPIIDMLVEIKSVRKAKKKIVPILQNEGYEYFWRPSIGENPPFYMWFIKRNKRGERTHHIHMVEKGSELWKRLNFRDYLIKNPAPAEKYDILKKYLSKKYPNDRVKYTKAKSEFVEQINQKSKEDDIS